MTLGRNILIIIGVVALAVIVGGYYYFAGRNPGNTTAPSTNTPETNTTPESTPNTNITPETPLPQTSTPEQGESNISMKDNQYNPAMLTVKRGSKVTWKNDENGDIQHTATSDTGVFDSGTVNRGGEFSYTFNDLGTFNYHCTNHPNMKGIIKVVAELPVPESATIPKKVPNTGHAYGQ